MKKLWKKVRAYEYYGDIERNLKTMVVDKLTKVKDKLRETFEAGNKTEEGDIKPKPNKEWRTVWKEREGKRSIESGWVEKEETPKIMMIRVQSLEEREDQRITEFQERGRLHDEEYNDTSGRTTLINKG